MMVCLQVETTSGELVSAVGHHVLLAKILRRRFEQMYGRRMQIRDLVTGRIWSEQVSHRSAVDRAFFRAEARNRS